MPRRPDSAQPGDLLADAVMAVLGESGATGFSVRALCRWTGLSIGGLTGRWGSRGRMLQVAVNVFRARWMFLMTGRHWRDGVVALLPYDEDELEDCRVWAAFGELARADSVVAECVAAYRADERELVSSIVAGRVNEQGLDHLMALVDGLRLAVCAPEPIPIPRAPAVLYAHLETLGALAEQLGLTYPPLEYGT